MKKKSVILVICMILVFGNVMSGAAQETSRSKLYINGALATEEERAAYGQGRGRSDQGIQPYWLFTSNAVQGLFIDEHGIATCSIMIQGYPGKVIGISAQVVLEKKQFADVYSVVTVWNKNVNSNSLISENIYKVPSNGEYRLRVEYTVFNAPDIFEKIREYSNPWYFDGYKS